MDGRSFQERTADWMEACFGAEISGDRVERGVRLLEEVFELLQSGGYDPVRVLALRDYVWSRDIGEPHQETGGVMVTLAAYCLAHGLDMDRAGEDELARVWTKVEKIRAKQAAKPTGSALPQAWPAQQSKPYAWICEDLISNGTRVTVYTEVEAKAKDAETCGEHKAWRVVPVLRPMLTAGFEYQATLCDQIRNLLDGIEMARTRLETMADDMAAGRCDGGLLAARQLKRAIPGLFLDATPAGEPGISSFPPHDPSSQITVGYLKTIRAMFTENELEHHLAAEILACRALSLPGEDEIRTLAGKYGSATGTPYEQGGWDMAMRIISLMSRARQAARTQQA